MYKNKLVRIFFLLVFFIEIGLSSLAQAKKSNLAKIPYADISMNLQWIGGTISDSSYSIWGCLPIMGDDGKVHVFVARWLQKNVDPGCRISSEVAHYVADKPEGPYKFVDVAVKGTGQNTWDKYALHNHEVKKIGKY